MKNKPGIENEMPVTPSEDQNSVRPQDDFYAAVNGEWLASTEIPPGKISVGGIEDVGRDVETQLKADFAEMLLGTADPRSLTEFLKFYTLAADYTKRNEEGAAPLQPYLQSIDILASLSDFNTALPEIIRIGMSLPQMASPIVVYVQADMKDAQHNALYMNMPNLILPDASFYDLPVGVQLLASYKENLIKLLELNGSSSEQAVEIAEQTLAFDRLLKPYFKSALENKEASSAYNPISIKDLTASSTCINLKELVSALVPETPTFVVLNNTRFFIELDNIINEDNFPLLKGWLYGQTVFAAAPALSEEMMAKAASFNMLLTGRSTMEDPQTQAYHLAIVPYDQLIGEYYGRKYFGEEAKCDLMKMVGKIRSVYTRRLQSNDWLSEETIKTAIEKLESMKIHIGYPEELNPVYSHMHVKDGSFLDNYVSMMRLLTNDNLRSCGQKINPNEWILPAHAANAAYHLLSNSIHFPAAILQEPLYSLKYSPSRNYGGIGAIIAHEITHAFDSNGAKFDQYGSLRDWWTEADYKAFQERTHAMVALFDGLPYAGGKVNGELTVTENVSDAGGLSSAIEIVLAMPDADLNDFFESWATIWRLKVTPEFEQLLLARDTHAPYKLRVNVQVQNLDAFYETFDVREGDGMYLAPEKRVKVW